jgi:hypothetical protein
LYATVNELVRGFEDGYFDGMQDMYVNTDSPWHQFGSIKYLHCSRAISEAHRTQAVDVLGTTDESTIRKFCDENEYFAATEAVVDTAPDSPVEAMVGIADASISHNMEKDGIEIRFPGKPGPDVLAWLKSHGYRWGFTAKVWYCRFTDDRMREAMIRFGIPTPAEVVSA